MLDFKTNMTHDHPFKKKKKRNDFYVELPKFAFRSLRIEKRKQKK